MVATLTAAVEAAWAADTLAGLADAGATLANGTELLIGRIACAVGGPAFTLPPDGGDPLSLQPSPQNSATCSAQSAARLPSSLWTAGRTSS